jgi:structural maintenance of chromosome 1
MPLTFLELENFKSYAGKQRIGPFTDFTSVIGPNGSGKSNLMDAVSFVLGVQSRDLRSSQMKDLIFRPPGKTSHKLKASAALIYQDPETDEEMRFSRSISHSGVGEYQVNGKTVTFAEFEKLLEDIGVVLKARNFLVFQGDVEALARKSPKELVDMFEQISAAAELREEYELARRAKEEADAAALFAYHKQKSFRSERRLLKDQKEEAERFHRMLEKKSQLLTEMYLWLLFHIDFDMKEREEAVQEFRDELAEWETQEAEAANVLKDAKKEASAARRKTQAEVKNRVQFAAKLDQLEPSIIQTTEEIKNLNKKLKQDEKQLAAKKEEAASHGEKLEKLDNEIAEYKDMLQQLEVDYEQVKKSAAGVDDVVLTPEQELEYDRVRQAAAAASEEPRRVLTKLNGQLEMVRADIANVTQELEETKDRKLETARQLKELTDRKDKLSSVRKLKKLEM